MGYEYDVFLSYRRTKENLWSDWINKILKPIIEGWLRPEFSHEIKIFVDSKIETGSYWPDRLGEKLARSRVLLPLFSAQYFSSRWCRTEFNLMLAREKDCGFHSDKNRNGLIIPAIVHNCESLEHFPECAKKLQATRLENCTALFMLRTSPKAEVLEDKVKKSLIPSLVKAIKNAPEYQREWENIAVDEFQKQFKDANKTRQNTIPRLF